MTEGPAEYLFLTLLSAMSISPVRSSLNSSRATSSPPDQDAGRVTWVYASRKSCFLELNRHRSAVVVLRPLKPGVCLLGDFTSRFLPRDGRTGLKLIAESGVSSLQWPGNLPVSPVTGNYI